MPGGEVLYVASNGAVGFTGPHSQSAPPGSAFSGFTLLNGNLGFAGLGATGFVACPKYKLSSHDPIVYQLFANVKGLSSQCVAFDVVTSAWFGGFAAWEYT